MRPLCSICQCRRRLHELKNAVNLLFSKNSLFLRIKSFEKTANPLVCLEKVKKLEKPFDKRVFTSFIYRYLQANSSNFHLTETSQNNREIVGVRVPSPAPPKGTLSVLTTKTGDVCRLFCFSVFPMMNENHIAPNHISRRRRVKKY